MTAADELTLWFVHTVQAEAYESDGGYGPVYAAPVTVPCLIDNRDRLVRSPTGDLLASETTIYAPLAHAASLPAESRVTVRGRVCTVGSVAVRDAAGLDLPEHVEATLI